MARKKKLFIFGLVVLPILGWAQATYVDSLHSVLKSAVTDSARYQTIRVLYTNYEESNRDSALYYSEQRLALSRTNNKKLVEAYDLCTKGYQLNYLGRFGESLSCLLQAFNICEDSGNEVNETWQTTGYPSNKPRLLALSLAHHMFGHLMSQTQNTAGQIFHCKEGRRIAVEIDNKFRILVGAMVLGSAYVGVNKLDSAFFFASEAEQVAKESGILRYMGYIYFVKGDVFLKRGDSLRAKQYYHQAIQSSIEQRNLTNLSGCYARIIQQFISENAKDSVLYYALKNMEVMKKVGFVTSGAAMEINIGIAYEQVALGYKLTNQFDSAFKYQGLALVTKDSLERKRIKNLSSFQNLSMSERERLQDVARERRASQERMRLYVLLGGIALVLLVAIILYRNNKQKQRANRELESTLTDLKNTQSQLIQSEKMASLGELTAGIAHEIQNPLNFVNNFSEVNNELIEELRTQRSTLKDSEQDEILNDIFKNNEKIAEHGKRADGIVKGMLQHSRNSTGVKERTDINKLTDEYLRLAFHGMRAKDKTFNATLKTEYDDTIGTVDIIPQDMGRVILNLVTNAFHAVTEKWNLARASGEDSYQPTVIVSTRKYPGKLEIRVADNGNGIPAEIKQKIFQPFFTTKPTGQGTGLGLSMSYDIVTKGHGGELKAESPLDGGNGGTAFIITIPTIK